MEVRRTGLFGLGKKKETISCCGMPFKNRPEHEAPMKKVHAAAKMQERRSAPPDPSLPLPFLPDPIRPPRGLRPWPLGPEAGP